jgi:septal ring factor EnvC (AmiA/AmiB activator)
VSAQATDRTRAESQARRASERLTALQREADALAGQQRSLLVELRKLEVERDLRAEQVKQLEAGAEAVTRDLANTANQIDALEGETSAARPALESRMVELYKLGNAGYLRLLFNVSDVRNLGRAYRMVAALSATDRQRVQRQRQNLESLRNAQQELRQKQAELTRLRQGAQTARAAAERAAVARTQLITQIDQRRDLTAELAGELQAAQLKLQQTLAAINAGVPRASVEGSALPIRPFRGVLPWPVTGQMLTRFGSKGAGGTTPGTSGVQLAAAQGSPVRAVHDGTVAYAGPFTGYGNLVILDHGAQTFSLYGQLGDIQVQRGAPVERGQTIGGVGNVPAGIPGIYFEMRIDGKAVDPLEWLSKRP